MSDARLFADTTRFREAVRLIHSVSADKFALLLGRIIAKLHTKKGTIFTETEEAQLQTMLRLSPDALHTVLDGCSYVFEQAAYHRVDAARLASELAEADMQADHLEAFQRVWAGEGAALVSKLQAHSLGGPAVLHGSRWELRLPLEAATQDASALFHLTLGSVDAAATSASTPTDGGAPGAGAGAGAGVGAGVGAGAGSGGADDAGTPPAQGVDAAAAGMETLTMQLSKEQLTELLVKLDRVQAQLDATTA